MTGESTRVVSDTVANLISILARDGKGRAEFPAFGELETGRVIDIVRLESRGIKQNLVPTNDSELVGGRGTSGKSTFEGGGGKEIEFSGYFVYAGGNLHMQSEAVLQIATPFQGLAGDGKFQSGEIDDGTVRGMFTGNPFRIVEGKVAGTGGNLQGRVENLAGRGSGVNGNGDGGCGRRKNIG
jgi:hypothetical protein